MSLLNESLIQARKIRDEMIRSATDEANLWYEETEAMLRRRFPSVKKSDFIEPQTVQKETVNRPHLPAVSDTINLGLGGGSLSKQVKKVVRSLEKNVFTSTHIKDYLASCGVDMNTPTQRAQVSNTLKRLVGHGELQVVHKGKGSTPWKYRRITENK